jgi:hypothetical protein
LVRAGFCHRLVAGTGDNHAPNKVTLFLTAWHQDLINELCENHSGCLQQWQPKLANSIPADFPDLKVLKLYMHPIMSQGCASFVLPLLASDQGPDVVALSCFAKHNFIWGLDPGQVLCYFSTYVFPGIAVRELIRHAVLLDQNAVHHPITPSLISAAILYRCNQSSAYQNEARIHLLFEEEYLADVCRAVSDTGDGSAVDEIAEIRAWLPVAMLDHFKEKVGSPRAHTMFDSSYDGLDDIPGQLIILC